MDRIPEVDFNQLCLGTLFWYKKNVIKVIDNNGIEIFIKNLRTGKVTNISYAEHTQFSPLKERIGMVNIGKSVVFISRTTARNYFIGPNISNLNISPLPTEYYPLGRSHTLNIIKRFEAQELVASITNTYPSIEEAYVKATSLGGACAFDKQFAITYDGRIYYKSKWVGTYKNNVIDFHSDCSFYSSLLGNNYEKDSRDFKSTSL
jgi:hypothetical protein